MGSFVDIDKQGPVGYLTLNRPPVNALHPGLLQELIAGMADLENDPSVRVIRLQSSNPKIFSAGADLDGLESGNLGEQIALIQKLLRDMWSMSKLTVAVIEGHCLGGGLELALKCDFRIAKAGGAKLGLPEINLGVFPGGGGIHLVSRIAGMQKALKLAVSGQPLTVDEAHAWGLIDHVFPADDFAAHADRFTNELADKAPLAVKRIKQSIYRTALADIPAIMEEEQAVLQQLLHSEDVQEGIRAFKEKRKPVFRGK